MCFGGGGDDATDYAREQAAEAERKEQERQAAIQRGLAAINAAFGGSGQQIVGYQDQQVRNPFYNMFGGMQEQAPAAGTVGADLLSNLGGGSLFSSLAGIFNPGAEYITRKTPIYGQGGGFDDSFYNRKAQAYQDFYMPQLDRQYSDSKDQLTYGLANAGTLRSSIANKQNADLYQQRLEQETGIRERGQAEATKLRQQVAAEKQALISQLMVSADPNLAANQAAASAAMLRAPSNDYDVLGDVFKQAVVGGGNVYSGYQQGNMASRYPIPSAYGAGASKTYS